MRVLSLAVARCAACQAVLTSRLWRASFVAGCWRMSSGNQRGDDLFMPVGLAGWGLHKGASPDTAQQAAAGEFLNGFAQCGARHTQFFGQLSLGGQALADCSSAFCLNEGVSCSAT